jgi:hypothetical protein
MRFASRWGVVLAVGALIAWAAAPAQAAGPSVTVTTDSAQMFTDQSLPPDKTRSRDKSGTDFFSFGETLSPPTLSSGGQTSDALGQMVSTIVTPTGPPFPVTPVSAIDTSGRAIAKTKRNGGDAFETDSEGIFSASFQVDAPTPFLFDGSLVTQDTDKHDCTDVEAVLSGPVSKSFAANDGECSGDPTPASKGWVVTDVLPEGGYTLSVGYDAAVGSIKAPHGTVQGKMLDDIALEFKKSCTIEGTAAGETLTGTPSNDVICGYGGNDTINGLGGADYLIGDAGQDQLSGGSGNDHILARDKTADNVNGGPGNHDVAYVDKGDNVHGVEVINP